MSRSGLPRPAGARPGERRLHSGSDWSDAKEGDRTVRLPNGARTVVVERRDGDDSCSAVTAKAGEIAAREAERRGRRDGLTGADGARRAERRAGNDDRRSGRRRPRPRRAPVATRRCGTKRDGRTASTAARATTVQSRGSPALGDAFTVERVAGGVRPSAETSCRGQARHRDGALAGRRARRRRCGRGPPTASARRRRLSVAGGAGAVRSRLRGRTTSAAATAATRRARRTRRRLRRRRRRPHRTSRDSAADVAHGGIGSDSAAVADATATDVYDGFERVVRTPDARRRLPAPSPVPRLRHRRLDTPDQDRRAEP